MAMVVIVVWSRRNYDFRHLAAEKVLESLFRLPPDPFDLVDVRLDVRHVQHQNDTALLLAVFRHLAAEKVLESLGDGVIALDDHDRLVSYNRAAWRDRCTPP